MVRRFLEDRGSDDGPERIAVDATIRHLYSPDLQAGWGIHVVQEMKLLARKADCEALDPLIQELVDLGLQRQNLCNDAEAAGAAATGMSFRLAHDGDVEAYGNSLFTALRRAMGSKIRGGSS
ncbi:hypothetical protein KSP40_PGU012523 [Platanthera guangdongensis]|uniref:Uncharacterized protein n=1 Tax=Platanthera guangdongensis TaxID=2320717 RepID=A0ABR2LEQ4_9ASPA